MATVGKAEDVKKEPQQHSDGRRTDTTKYMCYARRRRGGGVQEGKGGSVESLHLGLEMIREIRQTCFMASSNSTRSITALVSLYSFRACKAQPS